MSLLLQLLRQSASPPPVEVSDPTLLTLTPLSDKPAGYVFNTQKALRQVENGVTVQPISTFGSGKVVPWNDAHMDKIGLLPSTTSSSPVSNLLTSAGKSAYGLSFLFTGTTFDVEASGGHVNVWVGDKLASSAPVDISTGVGVRVTLPAAVTSKEVTVELGRDTKLTGLRIPSGASINRTGKQRRKLFVFGDSWIEGAAYETRSDGVKRNAPNMLHMGWLTGLYLDADIYYHGIGGTAYRTGTGVNDYGSDWRVSFINQVKPDDVLVVGSINSPGPDTEGARAFYGKVSTANPGTSIYVQGRQSYGDSTNTPGADTDFQTAIAEYPAVKGYVSPRVEKWITGTGNSLNGTGLAALYHNGENVNHLTDEGNDFYAQKSAQSLIRMVETSNAR